MQRWTKLPGLKWEHRCPERGLCVLTREQLGIFWKSKLKGECAGKESGDGHWAMDKTWNGCPLCGDFPSELDALVDHIQNGTPLPDNLK